MRESIFRWVTPSDRLQVSTKLKLSLICVRQFFSVLLCDFGFFFTENNIYKSLGDSCVLGSWVLFNTVTLFSMYFIFYLCLGFVCSWVYYFQGGTTPCKLTQTFTLTLTSPAFACFLCLEWRHIYLYTYHPEEFYAN